MSLHSFYADFHIHIGQAENGQPVKISASRNLTFYRIAQEASERKGIEMIGIIDCHSPAVQEDIRACLRSGEMEELAGGGIRYRHTTIIPGAEIELKEPGGGPFHVLAFFPTLSSITGFTEWMRPYMKNLNLSSQRLYVSSRTLQRQVVSMGGIFIPAHIFTPHKSVYGSAADQMEQVLDLDKVTAVELGLSAGTTMAGGLSELERFPFLSNSDAHSLGKIGREYNRLRLAEPNFTEWIKALEGREGRRIEANYGLHPRLGKYHRTYCKRCEVMVERPDLSTRICPYCGKRSVVRGVEDRIEHIKDRSGLPGSGSESRPPYYFQVLLEFIPGVGPKKRELLLHLFGTEMNVLHRVPVPEIARVVGDEIAEYIKQARDGGIGLTSGGGGRYGKVLKS